jgi:hypothetical protein
MAGEVQRGSDGNEDLDARLMWYVSTDRPPVKELAATDMRPMHYRPYFGAAGQLSTLNENE